MRLITPWNSVASQEILQAGLLQGFSKNIQRLNKCMIIFFDERTCTTASLFLSFWDKYGLFLVGFATLFLTFSLP
jgi:hypothetical protein